MASSDGVGEEAPPRCLAPPAASDGLPTPVVLDAGSCWTRCGFAGEDSPRSAFSTIVGRQKAAGRHPAWTPPYVWVGFEAVRKRGILKLRYPYRKGYACHYHEWGVARVLHFALGDWDLEYGLDVTVESKDALPAWDPGREHPLNRYRYGKDETYGRILQDGQRVMMTEPTLSEAKERELMGDLVLGEAMRGSGLYLASSAVCSLLASGRTTGLVVESGDHLTDVVPVYEGCAVTSATEDWTTEGGEGVAGRWITEYLVKILSERGYEMTTSSERAIVENIKKEICYVALDYQAELDLDEKTGACEHDYVLPDGSRMVIATERYRCAELLFRPELVGQKSTTAMPLMVARSIEGCEEWLRPKMRKNVVLAGGSTMFEGFRERLEIEVRKTPGNSSVEVIAPVQRKVSTWMGASVLASLSSHDKCWITSEEWKEYGPAIIHRKCF